MSPKISKTQIDRLGDRLREGPTSEHDIRLLDDYRRSFGEAYENVVKKIREEIGLEPSGRPAKSTGSIIEKLRRESIRLSQIQDIAGCRLVVSDIVEQNRVVAALRTNFPVSSVIDRRESPSHGYRAVHVIAEVSGRLVEIQVRTSLQHLWAELSEKFSDVVDPAIKYGGGSETERKVLDGTSKLVMMDDEAGAQSIEIHDRLLKVQISLEQRRKRISKLRRKERNLPESEEKIQLQTKILELKTKLSEEEKGISEASVKQRKLDKKLVEVRNQAAQLFTEWINEIESAKG